LNTYCSIKKKHSAQPVVDYGDPEHSTQKQDSICYNPIKSEKEGST